MAKTKFKIKGKWTRILCGILVAVVAIVAIGGITAFAKKDTKTISSTEFSRGGLDPETGKYVESNQSIYTKTAFACIGLRVVPDFESQVTYDVYYYDYDERLVGVKTGLSEVYDEDFPLAQYARIVIHPEGASDKDFKIAAYEVLGYANDIKITVDKTQRYLYASSINLYDDTKSTYDFTFVETAEVLELVEGEGMKASEAIAVTGEYEKYDIFVRVPSDNIGWAVSAIAATEDNKILVTTNCDLRGLEEGEWCKMTIEVPEHEGYMYLRLRMPESCECYVFGYND